MKNIFKTLTFALLLASAALFTSCNPELVLAKNLEGTWDVTSFTIDGEEIINAGLVSAEFEFDEYDGSEGDFKLTLVGSTGATSIGRGDYELNADGDEIDLNYDDGSTEAYDVEVDGDKVTFEGNIGGFLYIIKADRN